MATLAAIKSNVRGAAVPLAAAAIVGAIAYVFAYDDLSRSPDVRREDLAPVESTARSFAAQVARRITKGELTNQIASDLKTLTSAASPTDAVTPTQLAIQMASGAMAQLLLDQEPLMVFARCLALDPVSVCRGLDADQPQLVRRSVAAWMDSVDRTSFDEIAKEAELEPQTLFDRAAATLQRQVETAYRDLPADVATSRTLANLDAGTAEAVQRRLAGRLSWLSAAFLFFVVTVLSFGVAHQTLGATAANSLAAAKRRVALMALAIAAVVAGVLSSATPIGIGPEAQAAAVREALSDPVGRRLLFVVSVFNGPAVGASIALLLAIAACAAADQKSKPHQQLKLVMPTAAVFLASGVMVVGALYRIPASVVANADAAQHLEELARALTSAAALTFSVLLLSAYLGALVVLHQRRVAADGDALDSPLAQLSALATVFAPAWLGFSLDQLASVLTASSR